MSGTTLSLGVLIDGAVGATFGSAVNKINSEVKKMGSDFANLTKQQKALQGFEKNKTGAQDALTALNLQKQELALLKQKNEVIRKSRADWLNADKAARTRFKNSLSDIKEKEKAVAELEVKYQKQERKANVGKAMAGLRNTPITKPANALFEFVATSAAYNLEMSRIGNKANMTREQSGNLGADLLNEAIKIGIPVQTLQEGLGEMVAGGIDPHEAMKAVAPMGSLIKAYNIDAKGIGATNNALINNMGYTTDKLGKAWDILASSSSQGKVKLEDMAQHLPSIGATMSGFNMGGDDATASAGAWLQIAERGAGDPAQAANNFHSFLQKVTSDNAEKNANEMGFSLRETIAQAQAAGEDPIIEAIKKIKDVTGGDQTKLGQLFADPQVQAFLRKATQEKDFNDALTIKNTSLSADGQVDKDAKNVEQGTAAKIQAAGAAWNNFKIAMGNGISPVANTLLDAFTWAINGVTGLINSDLGARFVATLAGIGVGFSALVTVFKVKAIVDFGLKILGLKDKLSTTKSGGETFRKLIGGLSKVFRVVGRVVMFLGRALLMNPIGIAVAAIAGAAYLIWKNWDKLKPWFTKIWASIKTVFSNAFNTLKTLFLNFTPLGLVIKHWKVLRPYFSKLWSAIKTYAASAWDGIKTVWSNVGEFFSSKIEQIKSFFSNLPSAFAEFGRNIIQGLIDGVTEKWEALKSTFNALTDMTSNFFSKSPDVERGAGNTPSVPKKVGAPSTIFAPKKPSGPLKQAKNTEPAGFLKAAPQQVSIPKVVPGRIANRHVERTNKPSASPNTGNTFHFNISQELGESGDALAQRVVRIIEQKSGARRRSFLGDMA